MSDVKKKQKERKKKKKKCGEIVACQNKTCLNCSGESSCDATWLDEW